MRQILVVIAILALSLSIVCVAPQVVSASGPESGVRSRNIYGVSGNKNVFGVRRRNSGNIFGVRGLTSRAFGSGRPSFVSRQRGSSGYSSSSNYVAAQSRNEERPAYELHPMTQGEMEADTATYEMMRQQGGDLDY